MPSCTPACHWIKFHDHIWAYSNVWIISYFLICLLLGPGLSITLPLHTDYETALSPYMRLPLPRHTHAERLHEITPFLEAFLTYSCADQTISLLTL